jgi:4-amino-4-deoxy-L-arabinose transferase-like glycosyltransferase
MFQRVVAALAAWFALVAAATGAWRNVPLIDDWTYAWTVEHLLRTGRFRVLDWSSTYPVSPAIWGAAWSEVFGFSFASLRVSTLLLGVACSAALYAMLRQLDASPRLAWIGALTLATNPLFVFLSSSFMTDVPFMTFTTLALLCYVRAATSGETRFVWFGGAWALAAFLARQVGLITPVAALPLLVWPVTDRSRRERMRMAIALGVSWALIVVVWAALRRMLGTTSVMTHWMWNMLARPSSYASLNTYLMVLVGFYMLPAMLARASAAGFWRRPRLAAVVLAATAVLLVAVFGTIPQPLKPDQTWSLREVGASRALIDGGLASRAVAPFAWPVRAVTLLSTALLLVALLGRHGPFAACAALVRQAAARVRRLPADGDTLAGWALARAPLLTYIAAYLVVTNVLWMYHDRYYLVLVPPLLALTLTPCRLDRYPRSATIALVCFAAVALVGTGDALRFNQAVGDASQKLVDAGVPPSQIDAGYAWNGWRLYAHPGNLEPGQTPFSDVPWITSARKTEFAISTARVPGYEVWREVSWRDLPWPGPNRLLVLRRTPADRAASGSGGGQPQHPSPPLQ